ncbi:hypothetical protein EVAR_88318_1 [Eumeta japonica]|uniref:Uncharacterized protein n=1 Tax=Eumeta variegata TaxID=151549 RepID=A0A4C1VLC9_EUMVA|nr:hypothetical protein EVAR_88318_1 [Eumeta japonica]
MDGWRRGIASARNPTAISATVLRQLVVRYGFPTKGVSDSTLYLAVTGVTSDSIERGSFCRERAARGAPGVGGRSVGAAQTRLLQIENIRRLHDVRDGLPAAGGNARKTETFSLRSLRRVRSRGGEARPSGEFHFALHSDRRTPIGAVVRALSRRRMYLKVAAGVTYESVTLGNVTMSHRTRERPAECLRLSPTQL